MCSPSESGEGTSSGAKSRSPSELEHKSPSWGTRSASELWEEKYGAKVWITETVAVLILSIIGSAVIEQLVGLTNIEGVNLLTVFGLLFGVGMTIVGRLRKVNVSFSPIHGMYEVKVGGVFLVVSNIMAIGIFVIVGFGNLTTGNYFTVMGAIFGIFVAFYNLYQM